MTIWVTSGWRQNTWAAYGKVREPDGLVMQDGTQQVRRRLAAVVAPAQRFGIDADARSGQAVLLGQPMADPGIEPVGVESLQQAPDRGCRRRPPAFRA